MIGNQNAVLLIQVACLIEVATNTDFTVLSIVNQMKETKWFAGDFIDNQGSLKFCVQNPVYFIFTKSIQE